MNTYRFEQHVLQVLIRSNEEEVPQRLGISAETVALIVENKLQDDKQIDAAPGNQTRGHARDRLKKGH